MIPPVRSRSRARWRRHHAHRLGGRPEARAQPPEHRRRRDGEQPPLRTRNQPDAPKVRPEPEHRKGPGAARRGPSYGRRSLRRPGGPAPKQSPVLPQLRGGVLMAPHRSPLLLSTHTRAWGQPRRPRRRQASQNRACAGAGLRRPRQSARASEVRRGDEDQRSQAASRGRQKPLSTSVRCERLCSSFHSGSSLSPRSRRRGKARPAPGNRRLHRAARRVGEARRGRDRVRRPGGGRQGGHLVEDGRRRPGDRSPLSVHPGAVWGVAAGRLRGRRLGRAARKSDGGRCTPVCGSRVVRVIPVAGLPAAEAGAERPRSARSRSARPSAR